MARRPFSKPIVQRRKTGPPSADQRLSTAKPRSSHGQVHGGPQLTSKFGPNCMGAQNFMTLEVTSQTESCLTHICVYHIAIIG